jgi:predicted DNA binding protein
VDVHTRDGTLYLVFHAPDMDRLQAVIGDVRDAFDGVEVRRLLRSSEERSEQELVFVDSSSLTDRQREVLETAHEMGYFEHPKGANVGEVAEAIGITTSTFTEHLSAAQSKPFAGILGG